MVVSLRIKCVYYRNVDFGDILTPEVKQRHPYTTYDLVANIVHDGEPGQGTYRVHILHRATGQWYELQDLHVTQILPQMITLTEAYIQVCGRNNKKNNKFAQIFTNFIQFSLSSDLRIEERCAHRKWR